MSDRVFGGLGLIFSLFYIWQASFITDSFMSDAVGPCTFPYLLGGGLAIVCLIIMVKPDVGNLWPQGRNLFELAMTIAVMSFTLGYYQL